MLYIFFFFLTLPHHRSLDLYLSPSVICSNNCSGSKYNPFSDLNQTLSTAFIFFHQNSSENTLNLYFQGSYFIFGNQSFPDNTSLFSNWESTFSRNLTINLRPSTCPISSNNPCVDVVRILIKTQKVTISMTSYFSVTNIVFDWKDSLIDHNIYQNLPCYNNDQGCCSNEKLNNISDDCNVNVTKLNRDLIDTNRGFFDGTDNMNFILNNVSFINLFSISNEEIYFSVLLRIPIYSNLNINATTFQNLYLTFGLIKIESFCNETIANSLFADYNPYNLFESIPNFYFSFCIISDPGNSYLNLLNSIVSNIQFFLYIQTNSTLLIEYCSFSIRIASTPSTLLKMLGFFKFSSTVSLSISECDITSIMDPTTMISSNKMSILAFEMNNFISMSTVLLHDISLKETTIIYGLDTNNIVLFNFFIKNLTNNCFDPISCAYPLITLDFYNNLTISNSFLSQLTFLMDSHFFSFSQYNTIVFYNFSIYLISYPKATSSNIVSAIDYNNITMKFWSCSIRRLKIVQFS